MADLTARAAVVKPTNRRFSPLTPSSAEATAGGDCQLTTDN